MRRLMIVHDGSGNIPLLQEYLNSIPNTAVTGTYPNAEQAITAMKRDKPDVIIASIEILNAITRSVKELPVLVCFGAPAMLPTQLSRNIFAYLHAPFSYERVLSLLQNIDAYMLQLTHTVKRDYVFIKSEYKLIRINLPDILFLSGLRDYTQVFLKGKSSPLVTLQNLKDFETKLPEDNFVRVHRSHIISLAHVDAISRNEISIGSHIIPIGNAYRQLLDEMISRNS